MPVYNAERFLREAINSILAQSFKPFEFLIIDD
ncbi:MAG TPA: glycosyltransferase family A protein, partial [Chryseosolibacter sp.]|nr:glycosyltransferase family A protein [Chryseosolibacter sp.]